MALALSPETPERPARLWGHDAARATAQAYLTRVAVLCYFSLCV